MKIEAYIGSSMRLVSYEEAIILAEEIPEVELYVGYVRYELVDGYLEPQNYFCEVCGIEYSYEDPCLLH